MLGPDVVRRPQSGLVFGHHGPEESLIPGLLQVLRDEEPTLAGDVFPPGIGASECVIHVDLIGLQFDLAVDILDIGPPGCAPDRADHSVRLPGREAQLSLAETSSNILIDRLGTRIEIGDDVAGLQ